MKHLGLFSGIGGFEEAFRRAGANLIAACEIEPQAQKVLRRHFSGVRIINDVKAIEKDTFGGIPIELITGGFPCQDLSVAGRRAGLDGERSGLWFEYLRVIGLFRPRWVEIENVPGLLSSNGGEDFAIILRGLVELGYGVAWRVFDSQFDGVAQRRERVFIVASLGDASCAEVLFEREGGAWDSAPSREAGQRVAGTLRGGAALRSAGANQNSSGLPANLVAQTITAHQFRSNGATAGNNGKPCNLQVVPQISHALTREGADASEDGTGRGTPIIAFRDERGRGSGDHALENVTYPLHCAKGQSEQQIVAYPLQEVGKRTGASTDDVRCGVGIGAADDPMYTLQAGAQHGVVAYSVRSNQTGSNGIGVQEEKAHTLDSTNGIAIAFTQNTRDEVRYINGDGQITGALAAESGMKQQSYISGQYGVRRLTPRECERLQGFPDDWTRYGDDGREISDSARYRMLGNAVCLPTVEWIARRIMSYAPLSPGKQAVLEAAYEKLGEMYD
jgi:DNA (cytosine-5)-methyltransferase 1